MGFMNLLKKAAEYQQKSELVADKPKKRWRDMSVDEILHPLKYTYHTLGEFEFPYADSNGNPALNVYDMNVVGIMHIQGGYNPQLVIPQMFIKDRVILEADVNNTYDDHAVKVLNTDGVQIGWLPKGENLQIDIYDRLTKGQEVYARIKEAYELKTYPGNIGVSIEVARYVTG